MAQRLSIIYMYAKHHAVADKMSVFCHVYIEITKFK